MYAEGRSTTYVFALLCCIRVCNSALHTRLAVLRLPKESSCLRCYRLVWPSQEGGNTIKREAEADSCCLRSGSVVPQGCEIGCRRCQDYVFDLFYFAHGVLSVLVLVLKVYLSSAYFWPNRGTHPGSKALFPTSQA